MSPVWMNLLTLHTKKKIVGESHVNMIVID